MLQEWLDPDTQVKSPGICLHLTTLPSCVGFCLSSLSPCGGKMASNSSVLTSSALLERDYLPSNSEESSRTKSHGTNWLLPSPWSWGMGRPHRNSLT